MNFRLAQKLATAACAIAALYLLSILVTGGYAVNLAGLRFDANKLWPAIVAMLGFALLRTVFMHGSTRRRSSRSRPGFIVFALALIVFLANGRTISGGDSVPAKNLPLSILLHGNFYLDRLVTPGAKKIPYYLRESGGHYVSDYPVGAALMALPFYVPSIVSGVSPNSRVFAELEKISAATLVALSAVLLYMAAARVTANWMAMLLTLIYAFGTSSLSVSSQALWQHGPAQLALAAAIYCLIRARDDPRWAGYAGLPLAFEVITRPADALIAAPLGLYVLAQLPPRGLEIHRRRAGAAAFSTVVQRRVLRIAVANPIFHRADIGRRSDRGAERIVDDPAREWTGSGGIQSRPRTAFLFADFHFLTGRIGAGLAQEWRRAAPLPRSRRDFEHHAGREMA